MRFKITVILLFLFITVDLFSQDALTQVKNGVDLNVLYRNEATFDVFMHSSGFGLGYRRAKNTTSERKRIVEFEGLTMSNPKEERTINSADGSTKPYYFGQLNTLLLLRAGIGVQNVKYRKAERKSVEVRYSAFLGVSLALVKPVYVDVIDTLSNTNGSVIVKAERVQTSNLAQIQNNIYGGAGYFTGFSQTSLVPGIYGKAAISFEFGGTRTQVLAIETGVTLDAFPVVIPLMANTRNNQIYPSVYLSFIIGKKWF